MHRRINLLLALVIIVCTALPAGASKLSKAITKRGVIMWEDSSLGRAVAELPYAELKARIIEVQNKPCDLYFGRTVLRNPQSGLIGLLTGVAGVRVAMDQTITPEEGGMTKALFIHPTDNDGFQRWVAYIEGQSHTNGSSDLVTALTLRRKARILKFQFFVEDATGKRIEQVTENDVAPIRATQEYRWLSNDIFEPVTIVLRPELAKAFGKNLQETGPAFGPIPSLNLLTPDQVDNGRARVKTVKGCVVDEHGRFIVRRTDSVVLMTDLGKILTIDGTIADDTLGDIVGHELFHGIMSDMMGMDAPGGVKSLSRMGHDTHVVSDASMALSEGWAEFFEAWSGEDNKVFDNRGGKSVVSRFLLGRQVPIRRNLYTQEAYEKFRRTRKSGKIKNGSQMEATEGLVAAVFYSILTNDNIKDPFELILEAMYRKKPQTMTEMIRAMVECAPDVRTGEVILKTFLYLTKFATVSGEARRLYQQAYTAKLAFLRARNRGMDDSRVEALREARSETRKEYKNFVADLEKKVLAGRLAIDAAIGPELWMDMTVYYEKNGKRKSYDMRLNLNTATVEQLAMAGLPAETAKKIVELRDGLGCLRDVSDLRGALSPEVIETLNRWRREFLTKGA